MRKLANTFAILIVTALGGCSIQLLKPKQIDPELFQSTGIIFGSIGFDTTFHRFKFADIGIRNTDTGETLIFTGQEYLPDEADEEILRDLLLRQVKPGNYEITHFEARLANFHSGYRIRLKWPYSSQKPVPFTVEAGETVYLGTFLFKRMEGKDPLLGLSVPGGPQIASINSLDIDYRIARKLFENMPEASIIRPASYLKEGRFIIETYGNTDYGKRQELIERKLRERSQ